MTKRRTAGALLVLAAMVLASGLSGCAKSTPVWQKRGGPPRVVVTIPALDNFVRNVGGDHVGVVCLCTIKGPHHYEYDVQDAMILREADLFFAVGLMLDDKFADQMQLDSHNARLHYVKLGERLPDDLLLKGEEDHEPGKGEAKHDHDHGEHDPHVWLGIPQAIRMVELIRDELKKVDEAHAEDYDKNAADYVKKLKGLQATGKEMLAKKQDRKIIAFHESLAYFAKSFDLTIAGAIERAPGEEPTAGHLKELVEKCKNVRVIAVEPQYPKGSAATLLKELKNHGVEAVLVSVDPLETADPGDLTDDKKELKSKDCYEKKMRKNLEELAKHLQ